MTVHFSAQFTIDFFTHSSSRVMVVTGYPKSQILSTILLPVRIDFTDFDHAVTALFLVVLF